VGGSEEPTHHINQRKLANLFDVLYIYINTFRCRGKEGWKEGRKEGRSNGGAEILCTRWGANGQLAGAYNNNNHNNNNNNSINHNNNSIVNNSNNNIVHANYLP